MKNLKTPAQRPRKAPSNQTGGTAWGKKLAAEFSRMMQSADMKKLILLNFPYIIAFYMVEKAAWLYRHCNGDNVRKIQQDQLFHICRLRHPAELCSQLFSPCRAARLDRKSVV